MIDIGASAKKLKVVAGIVTSWTKEAIIGDCIKSVIDHVDQIVLVHFLGGNDATLKVAQDIAGDKLVVVGCPHERLPDARNFALRAAMEFKADWCITLDTDERFICDENLKDILNHVPPQVGYILLRRDDKTHVKEKIYRIPATGHYEYCVHEEWQSDATCALLEGVSFTELEKTPEQLRIRSEADLVGLEEQLALEPNKYRWHFYRAIALEFLGRYKEALDGFAATVTMDISRSQRASSLYHMSRILYCVGEHERSLYLASTAMVECPGMPELAYVAGLACIGLKRPEDAIVWSNIAILNRDYDPGFIFREPKAMGEGPKEIIKEALEMLKERDKLEDGAEPEENHV